MKCLRLESGGFADRYSVSIYGDRFGTAVMLSGDGSTLAIGASYELRAATGTNGDQEDSTVWMKGAVYLY